VLNFYFSVSVYAFYDPMKKEKTIYLIDGSAYIHRAYHAIRGLSNSKGLPTNAIFGFTRMLLKLIDDCNPKYTGMFFDAKGPTFRHDMYADYKADAGRYGRSNPLYQKDYGCI
jgi:5'-3' exonuclease